jgi:ParB family chromosome partitioning protein
MPNSAYQIVAGERRWRACRLAGLDSVPVIIREMSDSECMELALIENLQREDLGAVEAAEGYKHLMDKYGFTQEQVAESVGKSRPAITNALRLLNLPQEVLERLKDGSITAGHARAMIGLDSERISLALMLAMKGASVREIEKIGKNTRVKAAKQPQNSYFKEVELALQTELGRRVKVSGSGKKGQLQIEFYSHDDLADLARRLADKQ